MIINMKAGMELNMAQNPDAFVLEVYLSYLLHYQ